MLHRRISTWHQFSSKHHATPQDTEKDSSSGTSNMNTNPKNNPNRFLKSVPILAGSLVAAAIMAVGSRIAFASDPLSSISLTSQAATSWWTAVAETGFYQAFSLVFLSEIGDKTFFIAGLLAMKTSKVISFLGSMAALGVMTIISVLIGQVFHAVPTGFLGDGGIPLDDVAACLAFAFFGFKTLKEALEMEEGESVMDEELAEAQQTVDESRTIREVTRFGQLASIFGLVFAAEFGDRSFLSTIALSAAQNPFSVAAGGIAAHAAATGIAVSSGSIVAKYISEKVIGIIGGSLFILFAVTTALGIF
ncbi:hypothetical protein ACA910_015496 [Epithemia clementina (nom. ined.)]